MKNRQQKKNRVTFFRKYPKMNDLVNNIFYGGEEPQPLPKKERWIGKPPKRRGVGMVYLVGLGE